MVADRDRELLVGNLSERCIAARLAMYLQHAFADFEVDVEYNRDGHHPKRLGISEDCANSRDADGNALVVPDIIVHRRGPKGPNVLVIELKKTTNPIGTGCDQERLLAFRRTFKYQFGALVECETRAGSEPAMTLLEWIDE